MEFDWQSIVLMVLAAVGTMFMGFVTYAVRKGLNSVREFVERTENTIDDRLFDIVYGGLKAAIEDADGDGVPDDEDAAPHDPDVS